MSDNDTNTTAVAACAAARVAWAAADADTTTNAPCGGKGDIMELKAENNLPGRVVYEAAHKSEEVIVVIPDRYDIDGYARTLEPHFDFQKCETTRNPDGSLKLEGMRDNHPVSITIKRA